jgi:hypothetical protein
MIGRRDVYKCVGEFIVPQSQCPHFPTKVPQPLPPPPLLPPRSRDGRA